MQYEILKTEAEVLSLVEWHNYNSQHVILDLETTGLDSFTDEIVDIQISGRENESVAIFSGNLASALQHLESRPVGHNLKFDVTFLVRKGHTFALKWQYHDTLLLAHLENENRASYSLDALLKEFYGPEVNYKTEFWAKYKSYWDAPEDERYRYGALDVYYTRKLYIDLLERLKCAGIY